MKCGYSRSQEICIYRNKDDSCHYPKADELTEECIFGSKFVIDTLAEFVKGLNGHDKSVIKRYLECLSQYNSGPI